MDAPDEPTAKKDDPTARRTLRVLVPERTLAQLRVLKILDGGEMSATVDAAVRAYLARRWGA